MLGSIRPDAFGVSGAYGVMSGRASAASQAPVSPVAPVRAQTREEARAAADEQQLMHYLGNITRADASAVVALTRPSRDEATASYAAVASAYGDV